jgi:hypothetical protein
MDEFLLALGEAHAEARAAKAQGDRGSYGTLE